MPDSPALLQDSSFSEAVPLALAPSPCWMPSLDCGCGGAAGFSCAWPSHSPRADPRFILKAGCAHQAVSPHAPMPPCPVYDPVPCPMHPCPVYAPVPESNAPMRCLYPWAVLIPPYPVYTPAPRPVHPCAVYAPRCLCCVSCPQTLSMPLLHVQCTHALRIPLVRWRMPPWPLQTPVPCQTPMTPVPFRIWRAVFSRIPYPVHPMPLCPAGSRTANPPVLNEPLGPAFQRPARLSPKCRFIDCGGFCSLVCRYIGSNVKEQP